MSKPYAQLLPTQGNNFITEVFSCHFLLPSTLFSTLYSKGEELCTGGRSNLLSGTADIKNNQLLLTQREHNLQIYIKYM